MKTYWNYEVSINGRCVMSAGEVQLSAALSKAISDAVYYQAVNPREKIIICGIREACAGCHNEGTVLIRRPRSVKRVKCPECKGKTAQGAMEPIPFAMPDPANRIQLMQA